MRALLLAAIHIRGKETMSESEGQRHVESFSALHHGTVLYHLHAPIRVLRSLVLVVNLYPYLVKHVLREQKTDEFDIGF